LLARLSSTDIYTLSLHDALPIWFEPNIRRKVKANSDNMADKNENKTLKYILIAVGLIVLSPVILGVLSSIVGLIVGAFILSIALDRKSTRLNSSHVSISYAVFCF